MLDTDLHFKLNTILLLFFSLLCQHAPQWLIIRTIS
jgi:hypothetical protein